MGDARPLADPSRVDARAEAVATAENLLIDLDQPRFADVEVHHAIEELHRETGILPQRYHRAPEGVLAWVDAAFGGTASSEVAAGGCWVLESDAGPLGLAAFDVRGRAAHWMGAWRARATVASLGPLGVVPEAPQRERLERVLLHAACQSTRERGYRQALVPLVADAERKAFYAREADAWFAQRVDLTRGGRRFRTTILASGDGSNFEGVARAAADGRLPLDVVRLVVNRPVARALARAERLGIPSEVVAWRRREESRDDYDARVLAAVAATEPDLVLLLGWMHVFSPLFVARFPHLVNLHPAMLPLDPSRDEVTMPDGDVVPAFRGAHAVDDALAAGSCWFGASVHRVGVAVDRGAILARTPLRLDPAEPRATIDERLHAAERRTLVSAIRRWADELA